MEALPDILNDILIQSYYLMQRHIADPLWGGDMVSKDLQKKLIKKYCGYKTDSAKYKKMITYRRACNRAHSMENVKQNLTVSQYFREMGLSPLCTSDEILYIPAFADLLAERASMKTKRFWGQF